MRRFKVETSIGEIEGIEFSDGVVVVRWMTEKRSTVVWSSLQDFIDVSISHIPNRSISWID